MKGDRFEVREVQSMNTKYAFIARDNGSGWVLTNYETRDGNTIHPQELAKKAGFDYYESAWTIGGNKFPDLVESAGFQVLKYTPPKDKNDTAVLVFSLPGPANPTKEMRVGISEGTVVFDPVHDWRIVKYEYSLAGSKSPQGLIRGSIDYRDDGIIHRIHHTFQFGEKYTKTIELTTDSAVEGAIPESEFSLTAYGMPEPTGDKSITTPRSNSYLYLILIALLFAVMGYAYTRLRRKG
jgi:hypothetical protein